MFARHTSALLQSPSLMGRSVGRLGSYATAAVEDVSTTRATVSLNRAQLPRTFSVPFTAGSRS